MCNVKVVVSDKMSTFLLLSFNKKEGKEFKRDDLVKKIESKTYEGIEKWKKTYRNRLIEVYHWNPDDEGDKKRIRELCNPKLFFQFAGRNEKRDHEKNTVFSLPLLGRHDFVYLLEGPNLVEMSSMLYYISKKLEEEDSVADSSNMSGVPMDFCMNGKYFLGGERCWFAKDEESQREGKNPSEKIEVFKNWVYAIVCVEFKKRLEEGDEFVGLPDLLKKLDNLSENSRNCIKGIFLGFGLHELILILGSRRVSDIIFTVADLRMVYDPKEGQAVVRDTSTIFGIPRKDFKKNEYEPEECEIEYSTLLNIVAGKDVETVEEIKKRGKKFKKEKWIKGELGIFERQGYYDLIVSFKPCSHFLAAQITTELYEIKPVLKTSTLVKMDELDLMEKLDFWTQRVVINE